MIITKRCRLHTASKWLCCALVLGLISPLTAAEPLVGSIEVDASKVTGPVNRLIFGHNVEAADSAGIFGAVTVKDKIYRGDGFWIPELNKPSDVVLGKARDVGISMLRYPGGCLVHNYDWRKSVGPREARGDWQFGLDEFLRVCQELKIEPLIMVSDYVLDADQMPAYAAQLVEYLNAPATKQYPWALKRKEWGHAEPYGVKWFELGNESDNGNHDLVPHRRFSPDGYAKYAIGCIQAMKEVDPSIKIGIHASTTSAAETEWNKIVFQAAGKYADFVVAHIYLGGSGQTITKDNEQQAYVAGLSCSNQFESALKRFNREIVKDCGRSLPLALTEYNNSFPGDKPKPYRFTLAGGLIAADAVRSMLNPEYHIGVANFWQMFYGYFGPVRIDLKPNPDYKTHDLGGFKMFRLWGQHFGEELVNVTVTSPKMEVEGFGTISPSRGTEFKPALLIKEMVVTDGLLLDEIDNAKIKTAVTDEGWLRFDMDQITGNSYPTIGRYLRPDEVGADGADYNLECEARFIPAPGSEGAPVGLGLCDNRGWDATQSAISIAGINSPQWKEVSGTLRALKNSPGVQVLLRIEPGAKTVTGRLEVRNLRLRVYSKALFPAYDLLTACASLSKDKSKLYLMIFNKSAEHAIITDVRVNGFTIAQARRWEVNGPALGAIENVDEVVSNVPVNVFDNGLRYGFPAHSMTAIEMIKSVTGDQK